MIFSDYMSLSMYLVFWNHFYSSSGFSFQLLGTKLPVRVFILPWPSKTSWWYRIQDLNWKSRGYVCLHDQLTSYFCYYIMQTKYLKLCSYILWNRIMFLLCPADVCYWCYSWKELILYSIHKRHTNIDMGNYLNFHNLTER